jgi:signal transduction histidine kinase
MRRVHAAEGLHDEQLRDSLLLFLDELIETIERKKGPLFEERRSALAREHGGQRQFLKLDISDLVQEYYFLLESVVELAEELGVSLEQRGVNDLTSILFAGAAEAVTAYAKQQKEQQQRADFERFAFVAHELRNPLSSVRLAWEVTRQTKAVDERRATVIGRNLDRLVELIDRFIMHARLSTAGVELVRERVVIDELVADVCADSAVDADAKGIRFSITPSNAAIEADCRLLRSALSNLVRNAVKFSRAGGTVVVRSCVSGQRVFIEVEDECGGLSPSSAERVFGVFEQANPDRTGFGLGLAISKQAIQAHGGTLSVKNVGNKGCAFLIDLPWNGAGSAPA